MRFVAEAVDVPLAAPPEAPGPARRRSHRRRPAPAALPAAAAPAVAAACTGAQVLGNPGFESGTTPWTASAGVIGAGTAAEPAHAGTYRAKLDGYGSTHTDTLTQSVTLPADCGTASLSFWLHIDTRETGSTVYDRLDHPTSLLTPATGTSVDSAGAVGRTVTTATATKVRDFAWAAGPFSRSSTTSGAGTWVNTFWTTGISASTAASLQSTSATAIDAHASRFGAYPYGEVDVVLDNTFWFGGMEYPGFVLDSPSATAAIHELAHQWWYGIVGDDEYTNPWLDESFADYSTDLAQGIDGTGCWRPSWQSSAERISNPMSYWDTHSSRYGTVVYGYGKCALHDLRRMIGTTAMTNLLRRTRPRTGTACPPRPPSRRPPRPPPPPT